MEHDQKAIVEKKIVPIFFEYLHHKGLLKSVLKKGIMLFNLRHYIVWMALINNNGGTF